MHPGLTGIPTHWATLAHDILGRADRHGDRIAVTFTAGDARTEEMTYAQLAGRASALAAMLRTLRGNHQGPQFVLIMLPNGLEYVTAFYGCLIGGAVAVPFYPPGVLNARTAAAFRERFGQLMADCHPAAVVLPAVLVAHVQGELDALGLSGEVTLLAAEDLPDGQTLAEVHARPCDLALLQYTSGSTARPKGVMVSHDNLAFNARALNEKLMVEEGEAIATWLPLFHDMGLIGTLAQSLMGGMSVHMTTPGAFVRRPRLWLEMATRSRSTLLIAPNFAYDLCVRDIPAAERAGLDLSGVRFAVNAAEPVRPRTLRAFTEAFGPYGFEPTAFYPAYGMAEATLVVSAPGERRAPYLFDVSTDRLRAGVAVAPVPGESTTTLVGCGSDIGGGSEVVIVDPEAQIPCPDGTVGEIWTTGPSVAEGYWGLPELSAYELDAQLPCDGRRFLRTGDLGVMIDGELFVTGRIKDMIIHRGVNHYPQDLELTAEESHPAVRPGGTAVFTVPGSESGDELVVLLCELNRYGGESDAFSDILRAVRLAVAERHGVDVPIAAIVRKGQIPKTTSGKVRRRLSAQRWLDHDFATVAVWTARTRTAALVSD